MKCLKKIDCDWIGSSTCSKGQSGDGRRQQSPETCSCDMDGRGRGGINTCMGWRGVDGRWWWRLINRVDVGKKNVIRESVMSNLQQSHHLTGVEVDASARAPHKLQS